MTHTLTFEQSGVVVQCDDDTSVLSAMMAAGRSDVQVGCRSGGCGVCRVQVTDGDFECGYMSWEEVNERDRAVGVVLACRTYPRSDLTLKAVGKLAVRYDKRTAELIRQLTQRTTPSAPGLVG